MELLGEDPASIASYQFTSVEVKEKVFRFDGVFLPQSEDKTIWFVEVQFQKVHEFYSQLFSEIFLFLQQYRPVQDWGVDGLLEFAETILIYKLKTLSREEIERMFTLGDLRQTQVYQEAKQEGDQRGCLVLRNVITKQIARKFGRVPDDLNTKLAQLSLDQLGEIAEAIIDISALEELEHLLG